jgi:ABC-type cobalamin/Fe3+-siderophores transport systems, ATPase components
MVWRRPCAAQLAPKVIVVVTSCSAGIIGDDLNLSLARAREVPGDMPVITLPADGDRVMIARALAQEPCVMILDEPTAFLDLPRRLAHACDRAVLMSTHELDLALRCADRVWLLPCGGPLLRTGYQVVARGQAKLSVEVDRNGNGPNWRVSNASLRQCSSIETMLEALAGECGGPR